MPTGDSPRGLASPDANHILAAVPAAELGRLAEGFERTEMALGRALFEPNEPILDVYFPVTGVYSVVNPLTDGQTIEVATVGKEGFVGVPVFLGGETTPLRAYCQVPGWCLRMASATFRELSEALPVLRRVLLRYTQGLFTQIGQTVACNRAHEVSRRCARWLLMTHDRMEMERFRLPREYLSQMLGVKPAALEAAVGTLTEAGVIRYDDGDTVVVLDRAGLEAQSCECYQTIREEYRRLMGV